MWLKKESPQGDMFSTADLQRLSSEFPPELEKTKLLQQRNASSGTSFVRVETVREAIKKCIGVGPVPGDVPERIRLAEIATRLGLDEGVVDKLLPWEERGWLMEQDWIATRVGYQLLCKAIFSQVDEGPIVPATFAKDNKISKETFWKLVEQINSPLSLNGEYVKEYILAPWGKNEDLLYSQPYRKGLEEELVIALKAADSPISLISSAFQGNPPEPFLEYIASQVSRTTIQGVDGYISHSNGQIKFVPHAYVAAQLNKLIDGLRDGVISSVRYSNLTSLNPKIPDAKQYVEDRLARTALLLKETVVSKVYVDELVNDAKQRIEASDGRAVVDTSNAELIGEDRSFIIAEVKKRLARDIPLANPEPIPRSNHVFSQRWLDILYSDIKHNVSIQAEEQWVNGGQLKLVWSEVCKACARKNKDLDHEVLRSITGPRKPQAETEFLHTIKRLEDEAIQKFAQDWAEKVLARWCLHVRGLQDVADAKLRAELYSALLDYTLETMVPDFLKKSTKKGAIKGKTLERQTEKLRQSLLEIKANKAKLLGPLDSTGQAIQAFSRAIKLEPLADQLEGIKAVQLKEMAKNMEKDNDGPRLFLTLVLILHGTYGKGVLHASGKFAPKLLKQLATLVNAEKYAWLQRMKDAAKSGSMTAEEKTELRANAATACIIR